MSQITFHHFTHFTHFTHLKPRGEISPAPEEAALGAGRGSRPGCSQIPKVRNGSELGLIVVLPSSSRLACSSVLLLFMRLQMR